MRLNDEKRRNLHVGDTLIFLKRPHDDEKITKTVKALEYFPNFETLAHHYEMKRIYLEGCPIEQYLKEMERFYTKEDQENMELSQFFCVTSFLLNSLKKKGFPSFSMNESSKTSIDNFFKLGYD